MESIDQIFVDFIEKFKVAVLFISENFGTKDILLRKNKGLINVREMDIKNSVIKAYTFHGYGCEFRFKKCLVDIEFSEDHIGFTDWSFYTFCLDLNSEITLIQIKTYLKNKVDNNELEYNEVIFMTM